MSSLWMGEDHLVYVQGTGILLPFTEKYRRFRYEDIQYLAVTKTSRFWKSVLYLTGFLVFALPIVAILIFREEGDPGLLTLVPLGILAAGSVAFLILMIRNQLLGPTCVCDLKTTLKRERLQPLNRLHPAEQAVDLLRDVVLEKQRHLVDSSAEPGRVTLSELARAERERLTIPRTVMPAFLDFVVFGLLALGMLHLESIAVCAACLVVAVAGNLMVVGSLIRGFRMSTPDSIRSLLFGLFSSVMLFGGLAIVYFVHMAALNPVFTVGPTGPLEAFASIPGLGGLVYYVLFLASILIILTLAVAGAVTTWRWRERIRAGEKEKEES